MQVQAEIVAFSPTQHRQLSTGTLAPEIENRTFGAQADAPVQDQAAKPNAAQLTPGPFPRTVLWGFEYALLGETQMMRCNEMRLMRSQITVRRTAKRSMAQLQIATQRPRLVSNKMTHDILWVQ